MLEAILEQYPDEDIMIADGYDEAVIGVSTNFKEPTLVYSATKIIEILMGDHQMEEDEATEFYTFNIEGAYVGEKTPIFVWDNFDCI